jgi:hypothetical protein
MPTYEERQEAIQAYSKAIRGMSDDEFAAAFNEASIARHSADEVLAAASDDYQRWWDGLESQWKPLKDAIDEARHEWQDALHRESLAERERERRAVADLMPGDIVADDQGNRYRVTHRVGGGVSGIRLTKKGIEAWKYPRFIYAPLTKVE